MNDTSAYDLDIHVTRRISASPQRVFDAWLNVGALAHWMFGPNVRDERIVALDLDPRVGGAFAFRVERGGIEIAHVGRYLMIEAPHRLAFTWRAHVVGEPTGDDSLVEIEIVPCDAGCELTLTHRMSVAWSGYADRTRQGWTFMLDVLASSFARDTANDAYGDLIAADTIRFERTLPGPIERVWTYLTESDKRALWLAAGPMELRTGGDVELSLHNADLSRDSAVTDDRAPEKYREYENSGHMYGRIMLCEPPHRLHFTWTDMPGEIDEDDSIVEIELSAEGDHVRLLLTHRRLHAHERLSVAAGWHTHLGILEDHCNGRPPRPFWRTHAALEAEYAHRLGEDD